MQLTNENKNNSEKGMKDQLSESSIPDFQFTPPTPSTPPPPTVDSGGNSAEDGGSAGDDD